ncbi:MAG: DUF4082 domain-containing protein [Rhodospirillales bacterium]
MLSIFAISLFVAIAGFCVTASSAHAANFYVATTGNDSNAGTQSAPWRTIQKAANTMVAGDTVQVNAGTYNEDISSARSGTASARITIKAAGTATVRRFDISHNYITVDGFDITGGGLNAVSGTADEFLNNVMHNTGVPWGVLDISGTGNLIKGNHYYGTDAPGDDKAVIIVDGSNHIVENNEIGPSKDNDAFRVWGHDNVIRNNYVHDITLSAGSSAHADFIQTFGVNGGEAYNILVEGNVVAYTTGYGSDLSVCMTEMNNDPDFHDWTFRNNVFSGVGQQANVGIPNMKFYNNTFYNIAGTNRLLFNLYDNTGSKGKYTGLQVYNNIIVAASGITGSLVPGTGTGYVSDYNFVTSSSYGTLSGSNEAHGINGGNPQLVNAGARDFHLLSSSPAINRGMTITGLTTDKDGVTRPQGSAYDMGAFEYGGTTPPPSDITPPSVSLTAPASGATVSGSVTVSANASDNIGVASVDFRVDGTVISTDTTSPYSATWNTTSVANGPHTLTAVARDAAGNQTTSSGVSVTVNNTTTPPPGDTTAPSVPTGLSASAVSSSQINLSWSASTDNVGVTGYDVYRGGTLLTSVTGTSYQNTGLTANTTYSYQVRAKDAASNVSVLSAQVSATTQGTTTPPPATGQTIWGSATPGTSAADNSAWELGTVFTPNTAGTVTAIRFYAASGETGAHTARLWSGSSVIGGPYTVTGTGPGWITYTLPTPVALTANAAYTVSVSTGADSGRRYAYSANALIGGGNNGANLAYPANAGVYSASIGSRPTGSWNSSNYFRDIVFTPSGTTPPPSTDPVTLFTDSFEQSLSWTKAGDTLWYTGSPKAGTHSVRLRRTGSIEKAVSLAGYKSASVSFKMGANSLDGSEYAQALYYNGSSWVELARIDNNGANENNALNPYTVTLPGSTDNLASFALRFKLNGSGTGDYLYVDDVTVTATPNATVASAAGILPPPTQNPILAQATPITQPLAEGMERPEVATLQKVLNQSPETQVAAAGAGSPGNETSYFGSLTTKAVQKFQALHNIVTAGSPDTTGFGRVGPKTLLKLRELLGF